MKLEVWFHDPSTEPQKWATFVFDGKKVHREFFSNEYAHAMKTGLYNKELDARVTPDDGLVFMQTLSMAYVRSSTMVVKHVSKK